MKYYSIFVTFALILNTYFVSSDKPCAARLTDGESVVCVCNVTYCDDLTRVSPNAGGYVAYTSSKSGLRFEKTSGVLENSSSNSSCSTTLTINRNVKHQTIEGFGGSVTDSAAINWKNLSQVLQDYLITSYFGDNGLEYNMIRVPIGGTDFSTRAYAYNELPINDFNLSNFSLSIEDTQYKLPMIHAILEASSNDVHLLATAWSPPGWMKTNGQLTGLSRLKEECFQVYADYHMKFIEAYAANNVKIWGITTTNEIMNGLIPLVVKFNSLGFQFNDMAKWIVNNLGPTVRSSQFKDLKILTMDDQRSTIPLWFEPMVKRFPKVMDYIDGVAVHFYADYLSPFIPPELLSDVPKKYPGKFVLATEACEGSHPWQKKKVLLGSWDRAASYIKDILEDLNYDVVGWIDWNLCLNEQGGPNWVENHVDSPIIVFPQNNEFVKQPMFYAMGHISKFITRGSVRIDVLQKKGLLECSIKNVAMETTRGTIVVVLWNDGYERTVAIKVDNKQANVKLIAKSITTLEFLP